MLGPLNQPSVSIPVLGALVRRRRGAPQPRLLFVAQIFTRRSRRCDDQQRDRRERGRRPDNVIVVGANLDSVARGRALSTTSPASRRRSRSYGASTPSRTSTRRVAGLTNRRSGSPFGAPRFGLRGSRYYLSHLDQEKRDRSVSSEFDMIASSNLVYSSRTATARRSAGQGLVARGEQVYLDFFESRGPPTVPRARRRSDGRRSTSSASLRRPLDQLRTS